MIAEYQTPAGFIDQPYIYAFNPNAVLPLNQDSALGVSKFLSQEVASNEEFFLLRSIKASQCTIGPQDGTYNPPCGFQFRDAMGMNAFSDLRPFLGPLSVLNILPVCPEKVYPRNGKISFDIADLGTNWNGYTGGLLDANSVPVAQLLFEGVRRTRGSSNRALQPDQIEESYTYVISVPVNWFYWNNNLGANGVAATQVFTIPVTGWDFELMDVLSIQPPFGAPPPPPPI